MLLPIIGAALASSFITAQECPRNIGGAFMRHEMKTPRPGKALGAGQSRDDAAKYAKPASILFAEADRVIATFPSFMTRHSKHQAESRVISLWLQALAASREGAV